MYLMTYYIFSVVILVLVRLEYYSKWRMIYSTMYSTDYNRLYHIYKCFNKNKEKKYKKIKKFKKKNPFFFFFKSVA